MGDIGPDVDRRPDWANLSVIHRNTLDPRSSFYLYNNEADALSRDVNKAKALCLSGTWKFHLSNSPLKSPTGFEAVSFDCVQWKEIKVPGMWQMQGFGRGPHYTNVQYPFYVDPPYPPYTGNETGSYITKFRLPESLHDHQLRLRFEGVDSGFHVWVNGEEVGYSQGARNPSEFDVTKLVKPSGENVLAVRVYQFTDGSYIEDQDQWWLSGIFRDVYLLGFPVKAHLVDLHVQTLLDEEYHDGILKVKVDVSGDARVDLKLLDGDLKQIASDAQTSRSADAVDFSISVENPAKWTAETPYLYHLVLSLNGGQFTAHRVGFRVVEVKDGLVKINGRRVVFKGANRHEHHPLSGRTVPYEFLRNDLLLMKTHNLNAIRTCHQPNDPRLYDLADELGFWVMDEADLECHGFEMIADAALKPEEQKLPFFERQKLTREHAAKWTSDNSAWKDAYVDRAKQLVHRDKLHPSVVLWSLGNEAFYGRNHTAMVEWIKSYDPSRPIHYEPDLEAKHVDIHSRMYPHVAEIIEFGKDETKRKPLVLCEYIHAMGTGPGNIKEYVDAFYKYEKLQGGWVWEWANHGLLTKTEDAIPFYGYGGDFGDVPNDYNFVMDGVLNSDHTSRSALVEYKKALEPIQLVSATATHFEIINRLDFLTLDHLQCSWTTSSEGVALADHGTIDIPLGINPGQTTKLHLPPESPHLSSASEAFIDLSFTLKADTNWAKAGHEVALIQVPINSASKISYEGLTQGSHVLAEKVGTELLVTASVSHWKLDLVAGHLTSWTKNQNSIITTPLEPTFYRALTDNDAPRDGKEWKEKFLHLAKLQNRDYAWSEGEDGSVHVAFSQKFAPPVLSWSLDLTTSYQFLPSGAVKLTVAGKPRGQNLPNTLARIGVTLGLPHEFQQVKWYGRGPGEGYKDMKLSQRVGIHSVTSIDDLWIGPEFPQECSNRTDTRWLELSSSDASLRVEFVKGVDERHLFDFMASHFDVKDVDEAQHPYELERKRREEVVLRLDADHHGLGTGSCGPKTLEDYALKTEEFEFALVLR